LTSAKTFSRGSEAVSAETVKDAETNG